jgi:hydroxyethylthiazole kinase
MNETANAILALGALPVMAHAKNEVAEMAGLAGALVLNIGTLSDESIDAGGDAAALALEAARTLGVVASVTGAVDHVSNGQRAAAVSNGHELLAGITGTGCMSSALTGCFLAAKDDPFEAAAEALAAFGIAGEDAAQDAKGPGSFHVALYDALAALAPEALTARARIEVS